MADARPWLPAHALSEESLVRLIREDVVTWTQRWLGDARAPSIRTSKIDAPLKIPESCICFATATDDILAAIEPLNAAKLATALLGAPLPARLNAADARFIDHLVSATLRELSQSIARSVDAPTQATTTARRCVEQCFRFAIASTNGAAFDVYIDQSLITSARRRAAPPKRAPRPLGARHDALDRQTIRVGAKLGSSKVTLTELYELSQGDVLVLDTGVDDPVPMTVADQSHPDATCRLRRAATSLELCVAHFEGGRTS